MKQFFQLIIGAIVVGLICLGISHWFNSQDHTKTGKKFMYITGEYIDPDLIKNLKKRQVYKLFMKRLIRMKPWKQKLKWWYTL